MCGTFMTTREEGEQLMLTTEKKRRCKVERQEGEGEGKEGADWQGDELAVDDGTNAEVDDSDRQQWQGHTRDI